MQRSLSIPASPTAEAVPVQQAGEVSILHDAILRARTCDYAQPLVHASPNRDLAGSLTIDRRV